MNEVTRACVDCGEDISHRHGNARRCETCARACEKAREAERAKTREYAHTPKMMAERICVVCGGSFRSHSTRRVTCSIRCRSWRATHPGIPIPMERACLTCGQVVSAVNGRRYCSRTCASAASKRRVRDIKSPYVRHETCRTCGGPLPAGAKAGQMYCSQKCGLRDKLAERALMESIGTRACALCGEDFKPKSSRNVTCSPVCSKAWNVATRSTDYNHRRRARLNASKDSVGVSTRDWTRLLNRIGRRCFYCGVKAERLTMDHVIPLSRGGRHAIGNVVPACRKCNGEKHDDLVVEWRRRLASAA